MNSISVRFRAATLFAAVISVLACAASTNAALQFVGQWQVDDGVNWMNNPPVYSGQEAAALLFGGSPSQYSISTLGNDPNTVNNLAWYSIWGIPNGTAGAENLHIDSGNPGYNDPGGTNTAWSAYVQDNAIGATYTNYAFINMVPEPSSAVLFGLATVGGLLRRRR